MNKYTRNLVLDLYDYSGNKRCTLYDSDNESSGQACGVYTTTERNGWKELSFTIPSTYHTEEGDFENYRLSFLKADYRIRLKSDREIDWFLVSEPKISHNAFNKDMNITAGHISQLLKTKNLSLEFSDEEGNNTGTAQELLTTILEGTGWSVGYVEDFKEDNGHTKYRSLTTNAKSGAFKMISDLCDLFEAKPIYNGEKYILLESEPDDFSTDYSKYYYYENQIHEWLSLESAAQFEQNKYYLRKERVIDIISMNPFKQPKNGEVPDLSSADQVLELRYSNNLKNVSRTQNTENIVTKLFVTGGYGDEKKSKNCNFQELSHDEHYYIVNTSILQDTVLNFEVPVEDNQYQSYHFTTPVALSTNDEFIFSVLDPASKSYIWDVERERAYRCYEGQSGTTNLSNVLQIKKVDFNQLIEHGNFDEDTGWRSYTYSTLTVSDNVCRVQKTATTNTVYGPNRQVREFIGNHVYYVRADVNPDVAGDCSIVIGGTRSNGIISGGESVKKKSCTKEVYNTINTVWKYETRSPIDKYISIHRTYTSSYGAGYGIYVKNFQLFDLTQLFGETIANKFLDMSEQDAVNAFESLYNTSTFYEYVDSEIQDAPTPSSPIPGLTYSLPYKTEEKKNWIDFLQDYNYYLEVGLMNDEQLQELARYQLDIPLLYEISYEESSAFSEEHTKLGLLAGTSGFDFCKLNAVGSVDSTDSSRIKFDLDVENNRHGVIYRSDYLETNEEKQFAWTTATALNADGDPKNTSASMILIIHDTDPITWDKGYVKRIVDESGNIYESEWLDGVQYPKTVKMSDNPKSITIWNQKASCIQQGDKIYLLKTNSINGTLGTLEVSAESIKKSLKDVKKVIKDTTNTSIGNVPVYFAESLSDVYDIDVVDYAFTWIYDPTDTSPWDYKSSNNTSRLYFKWPSGLGGNQIDNNWEKVYYSSAEPTNSGISNNEYWYQWSASKLYRRENSQWKWLNLYDEKKIGTMFGVVYNNCVKLDCLYKGEYIEDVYTHTDESPLEPGRYCFDIGYNKFVRFSTIDKANASIDESGGYITTYDNIYVQTNDTITYNTTDNNIVISSYSLPLDAKIFTLDSSKNIIDENIYGDHSAESGSLDRETGKEISSQSDSCRTGGFMQCFSKIEYQLKDNNGNAINSFTVFYYDNLGKYVSCEDISGNTFETPQSCRRLKIVKQESAETFNARNPSLITTMANDYFIFDDLPYKEIANESNLTHGDGKTKGIIEYINDFSILSDSIYEVHYQRALAASNAVKQRNNELSDCLGDMFREGWWQDESYVLGDEKRLYDDAIKNIEEVSKPSNTYDVTYLDLYGSNTDNYVSEYSDTTSWQDITIMSAIHLLDEEIGINIWAYIDKIKKCYDQPWKTSISINTNLSTVSQHSFTDVMTNIANVVKSYASKQSLYERASNLSAKGNYDAMMLEGTINANSVKLSGGSSSWYTDDNGNIMFISADGNSAMSLTGNGFMISNHRDEFGNWIWRTFGTGDGFTADEITAGHINADLINAGAITTDKLSSNIGKELDISSNSVINMFVTGEKSVGKVVTSSIQIAQDSIDISSGTINLISSDSQNQNYIELDQDGIDIIGGYVNIAGAGDVNITGNKVEINYDSEQNNEHVDNHIIIDNTGVEIIGTTLSLAGGELSLSGNSSINIQTNGNEVSLSPSGILMKTDGLFNIQDSNNNNLVSIGRSGILFNTLVPSGGSSYVLQKAIEITDKQLEITSSGSINIYSGSKGSIDLRGDGVSSTSFITADEGAFTSLTLGDQRFGEDIFMLPIKTIFTENENNIPPNPRPFLWINADTQSAHPTVSSVRKAMVVDYISSYFPNGFYDLGIPQNILPSNDTSDPYRYKYKYKLSLTLYNALYENIVAASFEMLLQTSNENQITICETFHGLANIRRYQSKKIEFELDDQSLSLLNLFNGDMIKFKVRFQPDTGYFQTRLKITQTDPIILTCTCIDTTSNTPVAVATSGEHNVVIKYITE